MDKVFKAISDPSRRILLDRLHQKSGQTLNELCEGLDMRRQSVTQHLAVLEDASLVTVRWQGREKLHFFNPVPIHELADRWITKFDIPRLAALAALKSTLEEQTMQNTASSDFNYVSFIRTTPEQLWRAITHKEFIKQFWFGMDFDTTWEVGSPWTLRYPDGRLADGGVVKEFTPLQRFQLSWRNEWSEELKAEGYGVMTMEIEQVGDAMKLSVTHVMPVADSKLIRAVGGGWPRILSNLKSLLETGQAVMAAKP